MTWRVHMGQTMAECDCPRTARCEAAGLCLAEQPRPATRRAPVLRALGAAAGGFAFAGSVIAFLWIFEILLGPT